METKYYYFCKYKDDNDILLVRSGQGNSVREIVDLFDKYRILEIEIKYRK